MSNNRLSRRDFLKSISLSSASLIALSTTKAEAKTHLSARLSKKRANIVIVGAGSGGMMSAARVRRVAPNANITLIAPNSMHLYQPGQTYVAFNLYKQNQNQRPTKTLLPDRVKWIQDIVTQFNPDNNEVETKQNGKIKYDFLIVALGIEYNFESIDGLNRDLIGKKDITSVYLNNTLNGTANGGEITKEWLDKIDNASKEINILFTEPNTPFKGLNAPLDMLFLTSSLFKDKNINLYYSTPNDKMFASDIFNPIITKLAKKDKKIHILYNHNLKSIDSDKKIATFDNKGKKIEINYDFLHITPPMQAPKVVQNSPLSYKDGKYKGYLEVDEHTLQHKKYKNIFGVGDVLGLELSKSGGSAQKQAIVLQDNIGSILEGQELPMSFNGYTVAPIKTDFGKILLAEFNTKKALPTFPFNDFKPRWIWWEMDFYLVRKAYFDLMMRGIL